MGNDISSRRIDDEDTQMSGISGWSHDSGDKGRSKSNRRKDDGPTSFLDTICGRMNFDDEDEGTSRKNRKSGSSSRRRSVSDEASDDDTYDDDKDRDRDRRKSSRDDRKGKSERNNPSRSIDDASMTDEDDIREDSMSKEKETAASFDSTKEDIHPMKASPPAHANSKPFASAFAKRCYFTKAGIGPLTQHYEGITLTGNTVLMLASAMKLKGCPTICDEDLRRVEQTYPNQFSRMPDELLLSSGWRRISKYCHFSGKPIPDGVPFFHSKDRLHPQTGGYYFLLASSLGMDRLSEVEPLTIDILILLQTDFPNPCEQAPPRLLEDPAEWTSVTEFCFFSGGPINTDEDVYYDADFDGKPIYMLAFLSPNLTPEELYRLNDITGESALKSVAAVEEVDEVYNLTGRDFDDLKLYHLGPCRALPSYVLSPEAWKKVLPRSFVECREKALARAYEFEAHAQEAIAAAGKLIGNGAMMKPQSVNVAQSISDNDGYVEFNKGQKEGSQVSRDHYIGSRDEEEEFPDPEINMSESSENELSTEFDEFPQDEEDPGIDPIVSPNVEDEDRRSDRFRDEDQPMDEGLATEMLNNDVPHYESIGSRAREPRGIKDTSMERDATPSLSPVRNHNKLRGRQKSFSPPNRAPSNSPHRSSTRGGVTPKQHIGDGDHLTVDTLVDEVINVPAPPPRNDFVSPMSESSPSTKFTSPVPMTPDSPKPINSYTKSSAMRGAQELLKKNRSQRLAIMAKRRNTPLRNEKSSYSTNSSSDIENKEPTIKPRVVRSRSRGRSVTPVRIRSPERVKINLSSPKDISSPPRPKSKVKMTMYRSPSASKRLISDRPQASLSPKSGLASPPLSPRSPRSPSVNNDDDVKSEANSAVSATSSVWTDATDLTQKDSRRALILKMAKNRMKSKKRDAVS